MSNLREQFNAEDLDLLTILSKATDEELTPYLDCILGDDREGRLASELDPYYKEDPAHPANYWMEIGAEIQLFGGNSIVNVFRGHGPTYHEILTDVADRLKVNYHADATSESIEECLLAKVLEDALDKMSEAQRTEFLREIGATDLLSAVGASVHALAPGAALALFRAGGFRSYQIVLALVNAIWKVIFKRGLTLAGNAAIARVLGILAGPIGWVFTAVWAGVDIAGPAYRVTVPAVIYTAALRRIQKARLSGETI